MFRPPLISRSLLTRLSSARAHSRLNYTTTTALTTLSHPTATTAHLQLTSPRNAISKPFIESILTSITTLLPTETRTLIISSAHPDIFCAGADLKERLSFTSADTTAFLSLLNQTLDTLAALPIATIAAIDGYALGGGLELALACDLRVVGPRAVLGLPEARIGIIPGAGGTWRLPAVVGRGRALEMMLTGSRVGADQALSIGLANRVAEEKEEEGGRRGANVLETALALAFEIEKGAPRSVGAIKECVGRGPEAEAEAYGGLLESGDRMEGLRAFAEKRRPQWTGDPWNGCYKGKKIR